MAICHPLPTLILLVALLLTTCASLEAPTPTPTPWPEKFHALVFMNFTSTGTLYVTHNYYDWPNRRNINLMQNQLGDVLHDVEWGNGTSFYFTSTSCKVILFPVGIPTPDFLHTGSNYLGRRHTDGFLCDLWEKGEFIWYYEDVVTRRPVRWDFFDGISTHVMTFEEGVVLEDSKWQAPAYCFGEEVVAEGIGEGMGGSDMASWKMKLAQFK